MKNKLKTDKMVFSNALSMRVTKTQFQLDLMNQLEGMGYKLNVVAYNEWLVLCTNWNGIDDVVANVDQLNKELHYRKFIPEYNPTLFLELASLKMLKSELTKLREKTDNA